MASQLEIQRALNKAIGERNELLKEQSRLIKSQLADIVGLKEAWSTVNPQQDDILQTIKSMREALDDASDGFEDAGSSGQAMASAVAARLIKAKNATQALATITKALGGSFPTAAAAAAGFFDGLSAGYKYAKNTLGSIVSLVGSIAKGFKDVAVSIVALPFRSLSGLIAISNKLVPLLEAIARATEEVRQQFGDISTGAGRDVIRVANDIGKSFKSMGLDGFAVFGSLDERLQAVNKMAIALGPTFDNFRDEIVASHGAIMFLQKGLELSDEAMAGLAKRAMAMGTSITKQLTSISKFSVEFSKRFGISQKLISRDMAMMAGDAKNFGNVGPAELAKVSVYARKLGVDVKELLGIVQKFDTFESAAESAAMLSQAFGANVDAIALMKAQTPAEQIDMLRQSLFAAGKSADQLSRQELKLLAQTTGMSEETARAALSQKNFGMALKDADAQGKILEKRTKTTEEAISDLQASIERNIKPFKQFVGFLQAFADGFARGVLGAEGFRKLLTVIHGSLRDTHSAGIKAGEAFHNMFPGLSSMTKALTTFFETGKGFEPFGKLLTQIKDAFVTFFTTIGKGPEAVGVLFKSLDESFTKFLTSFDAKKLQGPAQEMSKTFGNITAGIIDEIAKGVVKVTELLTDMISGKELPTGQGSGLGKAFIEPIVNEFKKEDGPLREIGPAFVKLFKTFWDKYGDDIKKAVEPVGVSLAGAIFGPAVVKAIGSAIISTLTKAFLEDVVPWLLSGGYTAIAGALETIGAGVGAAISSPIIAIPAAVTAGLAAGVGVSEGMEKFNEKLSQEFGKTEAGVGASVAGIAQTISLGLVDDSLATKIGAFAAGGATMVFDAIESLPFGESISGSIKGAVDDGIAMFKSLGDLVKAVFEGDTDKIADAAGSLALNAVTAINSGLKMLTTTVPELLGSLSTKVMGWVLDGVEWFATSGIGYLGKGIFRVLQMLLAAGSGVMKALAGALGRIPIVGAILQPLLDAFGGVLSFLSRIAGGFGSMFNDLVKYGALARQTVNEWVTGVIDTVSGFAEQAWGLISAIFDFSRIKWRIGRWIEGIDKFLRDKVDVLKDWIEGAFYSLLRWFGTASPLEKGMEIASYLIEGLKAGLATIKDVVVTPFSDALKSMKDVFGIKSPSKETRTLGQRISEGFEQGLSGMPDAFTTVSTQSLGQLIKTVDATMDRTGAMLFKDAPRPSYDPENAPVVKAIKHMVGEAQALEDAFSELGKPIDINAKLERLGKELGLKNDELRIERRNLQVNLNISVTLEADKLAKVLSEHKLVSTEGL